MFPEWEMGAIYDMASFSSPLSYQFTALSLEFNPDCSIAIESESESSYISGLPPLAVGHTVLLARLANGIHGCPYRVIS